MLQKIGSRLSLVDLLHFVYLSFLIILLCFSPHKNDYFISSLFLYMALIFLLIWIVNLRTRIKNETFYFWFYFIYPVIYLFIIFQSISWLLPVLNSSAIVENRYDPILYAIDAYFVNIHPVIWFEQYAHPIITDIMYLFYTYYFFLPFILMLLLFYHKKYNEMQHAFFILAFSFYMSYFGYIFIPARGPRFFMDIDPLQGMWVAEGLRSLINGLEPNKYDAFPSVHQLINTVILLLAYSYERIFFYITIPISIGITISLFYCQYHYLIDVVAGTFLAIVFFVVAKKISTSTNGVLCVPFLMENSIRHSVEQAEVLETT